MKKTDARVRYTRKVLKESFLTLLKDNPVNKITVKRSANQLILIGLLSILITVIALIFWKVLNRSC